MRFFLLPLALMASAHAELLAHFATTQGNITVLLQHEKAPLAVANFITLAQGTRSRIDQATGALTIKPLYTGERFFRVINGDSGNTDFKIAQTGSGTGTNSGGPGYTFRDEFHPSLTHASYVLSMANSGPNSNGSQIFFTGNTPIPHLDNVHTIFGLVPEPSSRATVDAILAAGNNGTTITGVTFSRTDPAALAFDEHAQRLPVCLPAGGHLTVDRGIEARYQLAGPQPAGSIIQGYRSTDLVDWSRLRESYQEAGASGTDFITLDDATLSAAFYHLSVTIYPDTLGPASTANRTLEIKLVGETQMFTFQFNATGTGGTAKYSEHSAASTIIGVGFDPGPYGATWIIETGNYPPLRVAAGFNSEVGSIIFGSGRLDQYQNGTWFPFSSGPLELRK